MEKLAVNKSIVFTAAFVVLLTLLVICIPSKAQQNLYAHNVSVSINNDFNKIPINNRTNGNNYNNEVITQLKLTSKEKDLLREIKQLSKESRQWIKEANKIGKDVNELNKIVKLSKPFADLHSKAVRKANRYKDYELALRYDAEEFLEMSNSLLFNIYENHVPTYEQIISAEFQDFQQIIDLNNEAQSLYKKAKKNQERAYNDFNYKLGLEYLEKANGFGIDALNKQELAFSMYFNLPIVEETSYLADNKKFEELYPLPNDNTNNEIENNFNKVESLILNDSETESIVVIPENKTIENNITTNKKIIFKVQIGAFVKEINPVEFHGLSPISKDNKDQDVFTKFMVGEYYSYKAARESKSIITNSTSYTDAFIVAYVDGKRIPVDVVLSENK